MMRFRAASMSMIAWGAAVLVIAALTSLDAAKQHTHDEGDHADSHEAGHDDHPDHDAPVSEASEGGVVELSAESIRAAEIHVATLKAELLPEIISAPGEIQLDQYRSAEVAPLIDAMIVKRHARLGDEVKAGQPLITLASIKMAEAQGELRIMANEWRRVRKLGRGVVSAKRYDQARVAYEQGRLKLRAYGLDNKQINAVVTRRTKIALGQFRLNAPVSGMVLRDDFRVGQRIKAGHSLFLIADERRVWVEANLPPIRPTKSKSGCRHGSMTAVTGMRGKSSRSIIYSTSRREPSGCVSPWHQAANTITPGSSFRSPSLRKSTTPNPRWWCPSRPWCRTKKGTGRCSSNSNPVISNRPACTGARHAVKKSPFPVLQKARRS